MIDSDGSYPSMAPCSEGYQCGHNLNVLITGETF